jgi:hypothetical protein
LLIKVFSWNAKYPCKPVWREYYYYSKRMVMVRSIYTSECTQPKYHKNNMHQRLNTTAYQKTKKIQRLSYWTILVKIILFFYHNLLSDAIHQRNNKGPMKSVYHVVGPNQKIKVVFKQSFEPRHLEQYHDTSTSYNLLIYILKIWDVNPLYNPTLQIWPTFLLYSWL